MFPLRDSTDRTAAPGPSAAQQGSDPLATGWRGSLQLGRRSWFIRTHRRAISAVVLVLSLLAGLGLCALAGWPAISRRLHHLDWAFLAVALFAHVIAYSGYLVGHHQILDRLESSRPLGWRLSAPIAVVGFGGWLGGGGFTVDRHALTLTGVSEADAAAGVITLGALELFVLTPVAWLCALTLIHSPGIPASVTWPWVIAVPAGFALSLILIGLRRHRRTEPGAAEPTGWLSRLEDGLAATLALLLDTRRGPTAIAGIALYWAADIVALWAALRFPGADIAVAKLILGYATAYVFTRRTLPFAGVIILEGLLAVSLTWVGVPLAAAALAIVVYRLSDFVLTTAAALGASYAIEAYVTFERSGPRHQARRA